MLCEREERHFCSYEVFAGWCWYVWALVKEAEGDDVGEWIYTYYSHATASATSSSPTNGTAWERQSPRSSRASARS